LQGNLPVLPEEKIELPRSPFRMNRWRGAAPEREAVAITVKTIQAAAAAAKLKDALEIGYRGFGEIACTAAAKEGICAFLEKRRPVFEK